MEWVNCPFCVMNQALPMLLAKNKLATSCSVHIVDCRLQPTSQPPKSLLTLSESFFFLQILRQSPAVVGVCNK